MHVYFSVDSHGKPRLFCTDAAVCLFLPLERLSPENGTLYAGLLLEQTFHYCIPSWLKLLNLSLCAPHPVLPSEKGVVQNEPPFPGPSPKLPAPASPLITRSRISPSIKKQFHMGTEDGQIPGNRTRRQK